MIDVWMMLDELRERSCEPPLDTPEVEPTPPRDTRSPIERLRDQWAIERQAIVGAYRSGVATGAIARAHGVTPNAVRGRLKRAGFWVQKSNKKAP